MLTEKFFSIRGLRRQLSKQSSLTFKWKKASFVRVTVLKLWPFSSHFLKVIEKPIIIVYQVGLKSTERPLEPVRQGILPLGTFWKRVFFTLKTQKNKNEAECGRSLLFLAPDKVGSLQTACLSRTFFFKSCGELTFAVDTTREEVKSWEIVLEFTVGGSRREKFLEFQTMLRSL